MIKIVVPQPLDFFPDQIERLNELGEVRFYDDMATDPDEWLERVKGADVICTGKFGLKQKIYELENTFLALPFVGVGWIDKEQTTKKNITVSYAPGCNKDAVSEWAIFMLLALFRQFYPYINNTSLPKGSRPDATPGLTGRKVTILGKGNIGARVGQICEALEMQVRYFLRGDSLQESVKESDVVVDCLGHNSTTEGLLDWGFFQGMKKGAFFITVTGKAICDIDAMLKALDEGILAGVATDAGSIQFGDIYDPIYQRLLNNPKVLVTPHIAHSSDITDRVGNDMIIDNIKAWLEGKPVNIY